VIFKCCKLVPVLIGGILIQGKRYGILDLLAAILMSFGLILFSLADSKVSPNFDPRGYVMISLALVADAIIGNVQEKAMRAHNASNEEVVSWQIRVEVECLPLSTPGALLLLHWLALHLHRHSPHRPTPRRLPLLRPGPCLSLKLSPNSNFISIPARPTATSSFSALSATSA
jgi:drug/metabolite transporter (DMT)-like permease